MNLEISPIKCKRCTIEHCDDCPIDRQTGLCGYCICDLGLVDKLTMTKEQSQIINDYTISAQTLHATTGILKNTNSIDEIKKCLDLASQKLQVMKNCVYQLEKIRNEKESI